MPKVFINNLRLKNLIDTKSLFFRNDGAIIENFVYNELKKLLASALVRRMLPPFSLTVHGQADK